jgi:hypothetical protein
VERVLIQKMLMLGYANKHSMASVLKKAGWRHRAATEPESEKHLTHDGQANKRQLAFLSGGGSERGGVKRPRRRERKKIRDEQQE